MLEKDPEKNKRQSYISCKKRRMPQDAAMSHKVQTMVLAVCQPVAVNSSCSSNTDGNPSVREALMVLILKCVSPTSTRGTLDS